jgi:hypothetical protein
MLLRRLGVLAAALTALSAPVTAASASPVRPAAPVLTITGAASDPASYTMSQLTALPTETFTLPARDGSGGVKVTGVSLDRLVTIASPVLTEDGIALPAPRLVTDGDIKGGRYVSGVYDLVVGQGAPAS